MWEVAEQHSSDDICHPERAGVVGDELVVALYPPAAVLRPDHPFDDQQVRAGTEPRDHDITGPDPATTAHHQGIPGVQGGRHRRTVHRYGEQW
jgi:hypothetical protein